MSVIGSNILAGASGQGGGYNLTKSLRFRKSANGYLSRTMNATSTTYTVSAWVKRGLLSGYQYIFASGPNTASNDKGIAFDTSTNQIYAFNGSTQALSSAVFRDPSAWYHVVMSVNSGTATVYVNNINTGISQTSMSLGTYGRIGRFNDSSSANDFDGYMAEFNLIDGQALTPSSFGETSTTTGVWIPKKYTGTYGTNGFYLPFTDTTSTSTLGTDFSGNSNTWTVNNISLTSGSTYDSMNDVPTLTSATTANYATLNPITGSATLSNGNLAYTSSTGTYYATIGTMGVSSGKWYWEFTANGAGQVVGICGITNRGQQGVYVGSTADSYGYYGLSGDKYNNGSSSAYGATYTTNDVIGIALDMDAGTIVFYKNNASQGTAFSGLSGTFLPMASNDSTNAGAGTFNFGQRPFAYTPPTGFVALNTYNLPTPTIGATASTTANKYFDVSLYTGDGTSPKQVVTGVGFQPDFAWTKTRSIATEHALYDAVRGAGSGKILLSNTTNAEGGSGGTSDATYGYLSAFNSDGFTTTKGSDATNYFFNNNTQTYVSWLWKANGTGSTNTAGTITSTVSANTTAGFSIVTYTGTGANATVGHGLGVAPSMVIVKRRPTAGSNWSVWHTGIANTEYLMLNSTNAKTTGLAWWNSTSPTSTVFSVGSDPDTNGTVAIVAYCFAPVAGYSAFGSYTGNGSTDGPFIFTGFRPRFIMMKASSAARGWIMFDTARDPYNVAQYRLFANTSDAESSGTTANNMDILSNGFKLRLGTNSEPSNENGTTYIYMAFAESPFKYANAR